MRLTKKLKPPYERVAGEDYVYTSETRLTQSFAIVEQKLGQLEDIEEELGINLIILFYALKKGIYVRLLDYTKPTFKKIMIEQYHIDIKKKYIDIRRDRLYGSFGNTGGHLYRFKDYGKTWALTKGELENA